MTPIINGFHSVTKSVHNGCQNFVSLINQTIKAIWTRISQAYLEPSKKVLKLTMPIHPQKNTYPKDYKNRPWPVYLDKAQGIYSHPFPKDIEAMAEKVEPLEKVTPLHAVVCKKISLLNRSSWLQESDEMKISRLIANGANVDAVDIRGQTPAYWAAYYGNLSALIRLKIYGADLNKKDLRGKTLLRAAVKYGHLDVISFLNSHKVSLNERDGRGLTPLHLAAYRGNAKVFEQLVYAGADVSILDPSGYTAEDILKNKFAERYHDFSFIRRLFSSPNVPAFSLRAYNAKKLADIARPT